MRRQPAGQQRERIFIEAGAIVRAAEYLKEHAENSELFVLTDLNTHLHCLPILSALTERKTILHELELPAGDMSKNPDNLSRIWGWLTSHNAGRKSLLVNLGGGMVSDIGGFAASTYMRGIRFVNIPTSLLAMVDASVGGKTGINFNNVKNQVGTFSLPYAVFIDPRFLNTLPHREILSGYAEMIKHALIFSEEEWNRIRYRSIPDSEDWTGLIRNSISFKSRIVQSDFRDRGIRQSLNFGHTFGHAYEILSNEAEPDKVRHGEAVAWGMLAELYLSVRLKGLPAGVLEDYVQLYQRLYNTHTTGIDPQRLIRKMYSDKKNITGSVRPVLLRNIASPEPEIISDDILLQKAIDFANEASVSEKV
ncbi:MAG: 3-dehydroquinate synthase [Bacteroidia bacterium]|nr:3-dehydroquinate synthase [Bacteroidia bacterium]